MDRQTKRLTDRYTETNKDKDIDRPRKTDRHTETNRDRLTNMLTGRRK